MRHALYVSDCGQLPRPRPIVRSPVKLFGARSMVDMPTINRAPLLFGARSRPVVGTAWTPWTPWTPSKGSEYPALPGPDERGRMKTWAGAVYSSGPGINRHPVISRGPGIEGAPHTVRSRFIHGPGPRSGPGQAVRLTEHHQVITFKGCVNPRPGPGKTGPTIQKAGHPFNAPRMLCGARSSRQAGRTPSVGHPQRFPSTRPGPGKQGAHNLHRTPFIERRP